MKEIKEEDIKEILKELKTWISCTLKQYRLEERIMQCQRLIDDLEEEKRNALLKLVLKIEALEEKTPKKNQRNNSYLKAYE